ncbi:MAG: hypothetical protein J4432_01690 [DPANN group archaeon]|nr:hypothetical protein [DPANN group archaeon]
MSAANYIISFLANMVFLSLVLVWLEGRFRKKYGFRIEDHPAIAATYVLLLPFLTELFSWAFNKEAFFFSMVQAELFSLSTEEILNLVSLMLI